MKHVFAICLFAAVAHAHPLDDRAEMTSEIVIEPEARLELAIEFRYKDVRASYAEFGAGLDRDRDGFITRAEVQQRYVELLDQMILALTVNVDGKPARIEAALERFAFADLDNSALQVGDEPLPTHSWRILYRFVFDCVPRETPAPGERRVEFLFSGTQTVVHTPRQQMLALDARQGHKPVEGAKWDFAHGGLPRVSFPWRIEGPPQPAPAPKPEAPPATNPQGRAETPSGFGEFPAWLTLFSGVVLLFWGAILAIRRIAARPRGNFVSATMLLICGAAIVLGALMRVGYIGRL